MIHSIPGNPVDIILGDFATKAERDLLTQQLGLNLTLWQQWQDYVIGIFQGNLKTSLIYQRPVIDLIIERFGPTIELAILSILTALTISIPLGILSAKHKDSLTDRLIMNTSLWGVAIPNFWLGPLLILAFSLKLDLLPVSERTGFASYILPTFTLGFSLSAILTRVVRNSVLDILKEDYIRTSRSKGIDEQYILYKHVLKNALLPVLTITGLQFGTLLTGAVITEKIFDWPGLGTLMIDSLGQRDYPLVQGCVLVFSLIYIFVNLLTDISYSYIDPRVKTEDL